MTPAVLVLAGLDPSGGAGLLVDAEAVREAGARPLCVATALTVQTSRGVRRFEAVPAPLVVESLRALLEDEPVRALKLGMLASEAHARAIAAALAGLGLPLVLDPVLAASTGQPLYDGAPATLARLFPGAIVTPNAPEAGALLGGAAPATPGELEAAGRALLAQGARAALLKGGHLPGEPVDVLVEPAGVTLLRGGRLPGRLRGTGCRLASALAARLALGDPLPAAAAAAKEQVRRALARAG